jgi:DNA uptake protein ComE-like DNA-binding protein
MDGSWKDLFYFNRRERNGIFVLSTIIMLLLTLQSVMPLMVDDIVITDTSYLDAYLLQLQKDSLAYKGVKKRYKTFSDEKILKATKVSYKKVQEPHLLYGFNPNSSKTEDWMQFNLSQKQAKSILKYVQKGGRFKTKEDVLKMYVIDDELYSRIESYLIIADSLKKDKKLNIVEEVQIQDTLLVRKEDLNFIIELNLADTLELKKLKGIGSYYAKKIVQYRDHLGGFYSVNQLFEIERMREETVLKIQPKLTVDTNLIQKIHINSDKAPQMVKHPYITWNMAIEIQDFRDFHKKYKSTHDLVKNGLLNEELYSKLVPYLEL